MTTFKEHVICEELLMGCTYVLLCEAGFESTVTIRPGRRSFFSPTHTELLKDLRLGSVSLSQLWGRSTHTPSSFHILKFKKSFNKLKVIVEGGGGVGRGRVV